MLECGAGHLDTVLLLGQLGQLVINHVPSGLRFACNVTPDLSQRESDLAEEEDQADVPDCRWGITPSSRRPSRLNISAEAAEFRAVTGRDPREPAAPDIDPSTPDVLFPHPVYSQLAWLAVVNPAERTSSTASELLNSAHRVARVRSERRTARRRSE